MSSELQIVLNPQVTVVIPTLNRAVLLMRAVHSVLEQTLWELELVIVVDGLDADTEAVLRNIEDPRVRCIYLQSSGGASEARNVGVRQSRTKWVAFLDDDDEWLPTKLEKQLNLANSVETKYPIISTEVIGKSPHGDFHWPRRFPGPSEPICEYLFNRKTPFRGDGQIQTSMLLVPRELLEIVPFTAGLRRHQDTEWYLRVDEIPDVKFHFVHEPLVKWYVEENRRAITNTNDWLSTLSWLRENRSRITPRAYAGFVATQLAGEASVEVGLRAFPTLVRELFWPGRPGLIDVLIFAGMWLVTQKARRGLRSLLSPQMTRPESVTAETGL